MSYHKPFFAANFVHPFTCLCSLHLNECVSKSDDLVLVLGNFHLAKGLLCLSLLLKIPEIVHVGQAEVVPLNRACIEIESPYLGHLALTHSELLVELTRVELFLNRQQVLHSMEVVLQVVEDAADVEDCDCTLCVVLFLGVA